MVKMKNKLTLFGIIVVLFCILMNLCSCSFILGNNSDEYETGRDNMIEFHDVVMYSRKDVNIMKSSSRFGYGRSDDVYVALSFIYEDESIRDKHGKDFEVTEENIICILSEGTSSFFSSYFSGEAEYHITINDDVYIIKMSKRKKEKWIVNDISSYNKENDSMFKPSKGI